MVNAAGSAPRRSTGDGTVDNYQFDASVANRIINEVRGINRVTYDITSKPPGTIEWEGR